MKDVDVPETFQPESLFSETSIFRAVLLLAIAATIWSLSARFAQAKPGAEWGPISPEVSAWAKQQHNSKGEWCCDESDGHPFFGDYAISADGSVTLELEGEPHTIPPELVLKGKNPTGHAVWWYRTISGFHRDYCFAPGVLG